MKRILVKARPGSATDMQPILEALAGLLARFSEPNHRWLKEKNCIPNTGVFVRQVEQKPWIYKMVFYTPDDIGVQAQVDMREVLKNKKEIDAMVANVAQFIVRKRNPYLAASNDEKIERMVEKHVHSVKNKRPNIKVVK